MDPGAVANDAPSAAAEPFAPATADLPVKRPREAGPARAKPNTLAELDLEILRCLAQGLRNKEIAVRIYRSPHTVKDRLEKIGGILGAQSRTQIVATAVRSGLI
jgi:DNA-binding NarL/FixJ family response regulator